MVRALFIINPTAGRGSALRTWKRIEGLVAGRRELEAVIPSSYAETRRVAADAVKAGIERVVVLGGDGTLDSVADELAQSDTTMGMIPSGTGNDFAKTCGISFDPVQALEVAMGSHTRRVDLGLATGVRRHFLNVAGAGFDAEVAAVTSRYPKGLGGTLPYLMGAITTMIRYTPVPLSLHVDGQRWSGPATLVAVANGSQYGGGMRIAPQARRDDGLFDVIVADGMGAGELLGLLPKVYTGGHMKHPKVHLLRGRHVRIEPQGAIHGHVDGDVINADDLTFQVQPRALSVAVPPQAPEAAAGANRAGAR